MKIEPAQAIKGDRERFICRTELKPYPGLEFLDRGLEVYIFKGNDGSNQVGKVSIMLEHQNELDPAARFSRQDMTDFARFILEKLDPAPCEVSW